MNIESYTNGNIKITRLNGKLHSINDEPSWIHKDVKMWHKDGLLHRDNNPAVVDHESEVWYQNGLIHRDDDPAFINKNIIMWYVNGVPHREDGPAVIGVCGRAEWWINGKFIELSNNYNPQIKSARN